MKHFLFLFFILQFYTTKLISQNNYTATDICLAMSSLSAAEADLALDKILDVVGISKNFAMQECNTIANASAIQVEGIRYIFYNKQWIKSISFNNSYGSLFTLAHEVGHHVNGHTLDVLTTGKIPQKTLLQRRIQELQADEFAGFVLQKLGASLKQTQETVNGFPPNSNDINSTHPAKYKRLKAIEKGFLKAIEKNKKITYNKITTLRLKDGSRWEGPTIYKSNEVVAHGKGVLYQADGRIYKGELKQGKKDGFGEEFYLYGNKYKGQWKNNARHGQGFLTILNSKDDWIYNKYRVRCYRPLKGANGEEDFNSEAAKKYGNPFRFDNCRSAGTNLTSFTYEGGFAYGRFQGYGKLTRDGNIYDGFWISVVSDSGSMTRWISMDGVGKKLLPNGDVYSGYFRGLNLDGYGTKVIGGKVYSGEYGKNSLYNKALDKFRKKDYEGASNDINNYINTVDPTYHEAYGLRAVVRGNGMGDFAGAIKDLDKFIKLNGESYQSLFNKGVYKQKLKDYEGAVKDYDKALLLSSTDVQKADVYLNRGLTKNNLGDISGACVDFKKAQDFGRDMTKTIRDNCN